MADVFISYSQRVPEPTVAVADELTKRGFKPWYDVNLLPGQFFGTVIKDNIDRAQAVVTIWSEPALTSQWVPAEAKMALDQKKLICVRTEDLDARRLPPPFNAMHTPLWSEFDGLFQALIGLGVRPSGIGGGASDLEALTAAAQRDWRALPPGDREALEAFLEEYGVLAMYRRMAEKRLAALGPAAAVLIQPAATALQPAPITHAHTLSSAKLSIPEPLPDLPAARPEDVILRLDPGMHTAMIRRIGVSADGRLMATGSEDKTVKLWALPEGKLIRTLRPPIGPGDEGKVYAVALDPAGRWVAAGGWVSKSGIDGFVSVFDAATGRLAVRLGPLPNVVFELAVSPDGRFLAAGLGGKNGVRVWDVGALTPPAGKREPIFEDRDYGGAVYGLAFAADGRLAATSYDGQVRLYAPAGAGLVRRAKAKAPGGAQPYGIAFAPDGARLAIGYRDALRVDLLDAATLAPLSQADVSGLSGGTLSSVAFLPGAAGAAPLLAAGGIYQSDGRHPIYAWTEAGAGPRACWPGPESTVMDLEPAPGAGLAFGAGGPAFGLIAPDGSRALFRGPATADLRNKTAEHFTISGDGRRLRFGLKPFSAAPVLFDLAARLLDDAPQPAADLAQADVTRIEIVGWENTTAVTLAGAKLPLQPYETARSLAVAPDAKSFILGADWTLRRFDSKGAQLWEQPVPGVVWGVNLAREGRLILAAYGDGAIRWHRAEDGAELLALFIHLPQGPDGPRAWILFTPEGYYDASSPEAEKLIGWHVNRGPEEAADFYPVETFAATFKRPDKIDAALAGL